MEFKIRDSKPQVGIFELIDDKLLMVTDDVQTFANNGPFYSGEQVYLHYDMMPKLVEQSNLSDDIKAAFKKNKQEYEKYPRGRVDYNTVDDQFYILSSKDFLMNKDNLMRVIRYFSLPANKVVLQADEFVYGVK